MNTSGISIEKVGPMMPSAPPPIIARQNASTPIATLITRVSASGSGPSSSTFSALPTSRVSTAWPSVSVDATNSAPYSQIAARRQNSHSWTG